MDKMGNMNSSMHMDPPKVHRPLCGLRYDNRYSFASDKFQGITTTCFNDVVLEPLATWFLLLVSLPLLALAVRRRRSSSDVTLRLIHYRATAYRNESRFSGRLSKWRTAARVLYMLLVAAALLMNILQIVRLALANRGVGLLPFNLAGILIVLVLMHLRTSTTRAVSLTILAFWSMLLTFTSVALAGLSKLNGAEDRKGTEYLLSDEMIDVGVQIGLYAVFWLVEAIRLVKSVLVARKDSQGTARLPEHFHHDGLATSQSTANKMVAAA
ncbi:uncharacterized protein MEPE_00909 [Melanopsichium pennsylvanicum]|uniref:Uncharacterized protein n=2 Tax=Melanopsichium pennsylvanicum TaxID=63383 RepID=A0AAJ4XHE7_9BASI|nr:conserved hypothetical protein [Melanopsichium pennsylvanicum 4]SNX82203.1 uncharacterized protein MEPE_00909 [Melanopsichium pennsylvanicum]